MKRSFFVLVTIVLACTPTFAQKVSTAGKTKTVEIGTLVIDIRDGNTGDLVWTATATDTLKADAEAREAQVGSAPKKAFDNYPPTS